MKRALVLALLLSGCGTTPNVRTRAPAPAHASVAEPPAPALSRSWIGALRGMSIRSVAVTDDGRLFVAGDHDGITIGQHEVRSAGERDAVVLAFDPDGAPSWVWRYGEFTNDSVEEIEVVDGALALSIASSGVTDLGGTRQRGNRLVGRLALDGGTGGFTAFGSNAPWVMEEPGPQFATRDGAFFVWVNGEQLTLRGEPLARRGPVAVRLDERGDPADIGTAPDAERFLAGVDHQGVAWGTEVEDGATYLSALDPRSAEAVGPRLAISPAIATATLVHRTSDGGLVASIEDRQFHPRALIGWSSDGERRWERDVPFVVSAGEYDPTSNTLVVGGSFRRGAGEVEGLDPSLPNPAVVVAAFDASDGTTRWVRTYPARQLHDLVLTPNALVLALGLDSAGRLGEETLGGDALVWLEGGVVDGAAEPGRRVDLGERDAPVLGLDGLEEAWAVRPLDLEAEWEAWHAGAPTEREAGVLQRVLDDAGRRHFTEVSPIGYALIPSPAGERVVVVYAYYAFESWQGRLQRTGRWDAVLSRGRRAEQRCLAERGREIERLERLIEETHDVEERERLYSEMPARVLDFPDRGFVESPCDPMIHVYDGYVRARRCGHDRFVIATYALDGSSDAPQIGRRLGATEREICSYVRSPTRLQSRGPDWNMRRPQRFAIADIDGDARPEVLVETNLAFEEVQTSGRLGLAGFPTERMLLSVHESGAVEQLWSTGVDRFDDSEAGGPPPDGTPSRATLSWLEDVDGDERLELIEEVVTFRSRCDCNAMRAHATYGAQITSPGPAGAPWRFSMEHCRYGHRRDTQPTLTCRTLAPPVRSVREL